MQTFYAYQARLVITGLTNLADELELAEIPEWHTIARAAACLENLLHGDQPADIADITASLKELNIPNPGYRRLGKFTFLLVDLTILMLDGIRLGMLEIQPKIKRPIWIGVDMAAGQDQTVRSEIHVH